MAWLIALNLSSTCVLDYTLYTAHYTLHTTHYTLQAKHYTLHYLLCSGQIHPLLLTRLPPLDELVAVRETV